ncbi:MAG TPA: HEAT repeat domain-containing protein [Thermoanaerobaculia bacterium]|nr:HEAT repeat domain-containing protein [Thermoanaerobaculia bacterium]
MKTAPLAFAFALVAAAALAQQPRIVHGTVTSVAAAADLGAQIRGAKTRYIGYAVPEVEGEWVMCCLERDGEFRSGGQCSLDRDGSSFTNNDDEQLHRASGVFAIFYRVENGEIAKVRGYSMECALDASGTDVTWIEGVDPRKSVAFVVSLLNRPGHHSDNLMATLAMHADPSATAELERMLRSAEASDETRGHAAFWLSQTRGRRGFEDLVAVAGSQSASPRLREKAVFAISQSRQPEAIDELIKLARHDPVAHVRGQALFWLSQKAGNKAAAAVREALDDDPDQGVREKAVFAVSQLPDDQSIPMLVDLLKTNRDPGVRRKAAFWLGQKNDPRALAAIEEILRK